MGEGWCRRVGGGRGQSRHNITGKGQEEKNLFESFKETDQKKAKKRAVQADGWKKERIRG